MITRKPTFLQYQKPLLCTMLRAATPEEFIKDIADSISKGAEGFCLLLQTLKKEYRTEENIKRIFAACKGLPIYATSSYRTEESAGLSDEELAEYLLLCGRCGATLLDVMGDMFCAEKRELTYNEEAVRKQKELIDKIHAMGCEVLMSSHIHEFIDEKTVVEFALEQQSRGADIIKIVNFCNSDEELMVNLSCINTLKHTLDKPFLYLANGTHCTLIRNIGAHLGSCMYLCQPYYKEGFAYEQPLLENARQIRDLMGIGSFN